MTDASIERREPRQLDIIADTDLSKKFENISYLSTASIEENRARLSTKREGKNRARLSTEVAGENTPRLSTESENENRARLSTNGLKRLDARRRELGISIAKLCAAAGLYPATYRSIRLGLAQTRPSTMAKLTGALNRISANEKSKGAVSPCEANLRTLMAYLAREVGADVEAVLAMNFETENTNDHAWLQANRLRRTAMYLLVEGGVYSKADMGHAIGISRQAVHKAVAAIEAQSDRNHDLDSMMRTMMMIVAGK